MTKYEAKERHDISRKMLDFNDPLCSAKNSWGRIYVEAEELIPEEWKYAFIEELLSDDLEYRKQMEEAVQWFGVRWL